MVARESVAKEFFFLSSTFPTPFPSSFLISWSERKKVVKKGGHIEEDVHNQPL